MFSPLKIILFVINLYGAFSFLGFQAASKFRSSSMRFSSAIDDGDRKYASYVIYKSKGALGVKAIPPTWGPASQNSKTSVITRDGGLFFEMAPSVGSRQYDWSKKISFLLGVSECGDVIAKSNEGVEFIHDPHALSDKAGQISKKMKWTPTPDRNGLFVSLSMGDKQSQSSTSFSVPVSWGEYAVIESIMRQMIPKFLGFDRVWDQRPEAYEAAPVPPPAPIYLNL